MYHLESEKTANSKAQDSEIYNILKEIDINSMTPLVAFDTLLHLKSLIK